MVMQGTSGAESLQLLKPSNDFSAVSDIPLPHVTVVRVLDARSQPPDVYGETVGDLVGLRLIPISLGKLKCHN